MPHIVQVACGTDHTVALCASGDVWVTGSNSEGQLGLGDTVTRDVFTKVPGLVGRYVAAGDSHTMVIDDEGALWGSGLNMSGQLGLGATTPGIVSEFARSRVPAAVAQVACGEFHTVALCGSGDVFVFGDNEHGQLGQGPLELEVIQPRRLARNAVAVACGDTHTVLLDRKGRVWVAGNNNDGQLGIGRTADDEPIVRFTRVRQPGSLRRSLRVTQIAAGTSATLLIDRDGRLLGTGVIPETVANHPTPVLDAVTVAHIAVGSRHLVVTDTSGDTWISARDNAWHHHGFAPAIFGVDPGAANAVGTTQLVCAAGRSHVVGYDPDGQLWVMGSSSQGQLGCGTAEFGDGPLAPDTGFELVDIGTARAELAAQLRGQGMSFAAAYRLADTAKDTELATGA